MRFLGRAEGEGFEPSTDLTARNGFRDETRLLTEIPVCSQIRLKVGRRAIVCATARCWGSAEAAQKERGFEGAVGRRPAVW
jgi:hypothetical protein